VAFLQESSRCRRLRRPRIVRKKGQVAGPLDRPAPRPQMRWATVWRLHFAADLAKGMLIRFAVARSRAKIWTTIGSASHSLETPEKWPALPLACPPVCFWRLVALPAANCETHQRLRRVSAGHTTKTRVGRSTPSKLRGRSRDCFSEMQTELVRSTTAALRTSANARPRCDDTVCSVRATSTQLH
jgi:hypothetical protein